MISTFALTLVPEYDRVIAAAAVALAPGRRQALHRRAAEILAVLKDNAHTAHEVLLRAIPRLIVLRPASLCGFVTVAGAVFFTSAGAVAREQATGARHVSTTAPKPKLRPTTEPKLKLRPTNV